MILTNAAGNWITGGSVDVRWLDFMCWIPTTPSALTQIAGGYYYGNSAMVGINASNQFGYISAAITFTAASGSNTVPTGEWVRFAFKSQSSSGFFGEGRMFKGANLLGTTPDATLASGFPNEGIVYIGQTGTWGLPGGIFVDSIKVNDTTWPTRGGAPPPAVPKGWMINKPG